MSKITVTDVDDDVSSDDELPGGLDSSALDFAEVILSKKFATLPLEEQQSFVEDFKNYYTAASTLRVKLDAMIWAMHETGKNANGETVTPKILPSIRAARTGNKPGRKPVVKSVAEQLLRK